MLNFFFSYCYSSFCKIKCNKILKVLKYVKIRKRKTKIINKYINKNVTYFTSLGDVTAAIYNQCHPPVVINIIIKATNTAGKP